MKLIVTPDVRKLGIEVVMAIFRECNISNRSQPFEKIKKETIERIKNQNIYDNKILEEYRTLHKEANVEGIPPAEHLINLIKKSGRLPNINTVVDCYNLVSAETSLSIGAHDTSKIIGDVKFVITDGYEQYTPLFGEITKVSPGEYACMDDEKIICRLDIKQCDETKISKETQEFIVYVQGNKQTNINYLKEALQKVCELITEICGGTYEIIE